MTWFHVWQRGEVSYKEHAAVVKATFEEARGYARSKTPPVREGSLVSHPSISSKPISASEFDPDTHDGPEWVIVEVDED